MKSLKTTQHFLSLKTKPFSLSLSSYLSKDTKGEGYGDNDREQKEHKARGDKMKAIVCLGKKEVKRHLHFAKPAASHYYRILFRMVFCHSITPTALKSITNSQLMWDK